jgi:hypothetical protein
MNKQNKKHRYPKRSGPGLPRMEKAVCKTFNQLASRPRAVRAHIPTILQAQLTTADIFFTTSTSLNTYSNFYISMAALDGYAAYLALFDQYRIDEVEVWIEPTNVTNVPGFSRLASCVDYDDANVPTSMGQVEDHQDSQLTIGGCGHYYRFKPHIAQAAYAGAFTSFANRPSTWIDSASTGVQHYGVKIAAANTATAVAYSLIFKVLVSFRQPGIN